MLPLIALAIFGVAVMLYLLACLPFFGILEEVNQKRLPILRLRNGLLSTCVSASGLPSLAPHLLYSRR